MPLKLGPHSASSHPLDQNPKHHIVPRHFFTKNRPRHTQPQRIRPSIRSRQSEADTCPREKKRARALSLVSGRFSQSRAATRPGRRTRAHVGAVWVPPRIVAVLSRIATCPGRPRPRAPVGLTPYGSSTPLLCRTTCRHVSPSKLLPLPRAAASALTRSCCGPPWAAYLLGPDWTWLKQVYFGSFFLFLFNFACTHANKIFFQHRHFYLTAVSLRTHNFHTLPFFHHSI